MTEAEFWARVGISSDCWEWRGARTTAGYGALRYNNKTVYAHRFSWVCWNGPIPKGLHVCHHCDNPACVRPSHLFVGTRVDNMRDCINKGRRPIGEAAPQAKLRKRDVLSMREAYRAGQNQSSLARAYNVSQAVISVVVRGRSWTHVGGPIAETGKRGTRRKLSQEQARTIRGEYASGGTRQSDLASKYGVSRATISYVVNRRGVYAPAS